MSSANENSFTAQRMITLVPAALGSGQAGSQPSLSNDRSASVVDNLATEVYRTTSVDSLFEGAMGASSQFILANREAPIDPFKRSHMFQRSPPYIQRNMSLSFSNLAGPEEKTIPTPFPKSSRPFRSTKTRTTSVDDEVFGSPSDSHESDPLTRLGKKIDLLSEYIRGRNNVHHEIKRLVTSIKNLYVEHSQKSVNLQDDDNQTTQTIAKLAKQITVCCETQTTPTISNPRNNGKAVELLKSQTEMAPNTKRRRSNEQNVTAEQPQKKGKKRSDEAQDLGTKSSQENLDEPGRPENEVAWQLVDNKKRKKRVRTPRPRPDAIRITKSGSLSYAEMLMKMKGDSNLNELSEKVTRIRRTANGDLLLELGEQVHAKELGFQSALENSLGADATIQTLAQNDEVMVEIKDIDEATTKDKVHKAIIHKFVEAKDLPIDCVKSLRVAYTGTQMAVLAVASTVVRAVNVEGKVRIGWVICRIREKRWQ